MKEFFSKFEKPYWEHKFGKIKFSSITSKKLSYLFSYQPFVYQKAYESFLEYIEKYEDYDDRFKKAKNETAKQIKRYIKGKRILSYGCGTAYVEEVNFPEEDITLMDSAKIKKLGERIIYGEEILKSWRGDCVIGIQLVAHMSKTQLHKFFSCSFNLLEKNGLLIITHTPRSNILIDIWDVFKNIVKIILFIKETYIFWSWRRSDKYFENIARKHGFKILSKEKNKVNLENIVIFQKTEKKIS